jgi:hypothetical protein
MSRKLKTKRFRSDQASTAMLIRRRFAAVFVAGLPQKMLL